MTADKKAYLRAYYLAHREETLAARRKKYRDDPEFRAKFLADQKAHPKKPLSEDRRQRKLAQTREWRKLNKDKVAAYNKAYFAANQEKFYGYWESARPRRRARHAERYRTDEPYRLEYRLRGRLNMVLRRVGFQKAASVLALVGCDKVTLIAHIERQFTGGMTWDNVEIDHIRPCASFDLTDPAQQRACFHWSNLQPLSRWQNRSKGPKWDGQTALTV